MSAEICRPRDHHARDLFGEDVAPLTVISAKAPKVQPPPSGPRDECANEKFKPRYCRSETLGDDRGRRHFQKAADLSPSRGGALSPRAGSVTGRSSPRESSVQHGTPSKPMDLFSAPRGTWTPLKRNTSRSPSSPGYFSPSVGSFHDHAVPFDLVAQAARRLGNSSPSREGSVSVPPSVSGRRSPSPCRPGIPNHNYLPPAKQTFPDLMPQLPPAPSQQRSSNVGEAIQHRADESVQVPKARITRRRDSNASAETTKLIRADYERPHSISCLPGGNELGISVRGRGSSPPRISSPLPPFAMDDGSSGGNNLAHVARNCMQQKEMQIEAESRVAGVRANAKTSSSKKIFSNALATPLRGTGCTEVPTTTTTTTTTNTTTTTVARSEKDVPSRGSSRVRGETPQTTTIAPSRGTFGVKPAKNDTNRRTTELASPQEKDLQEHIIQKQQDSKLRGPAALAKFVEEVSNDDRAGPLRDRVPTPLLCEIGRIAWQEPVKSNKVFR